MTNKRKVWDTKNKALLHNALTHARAVWWTFGGVVVGGGTLKPSCHNPTRAPRAISTALIMQQPLTITSWNCRSWSTGASYLEHDCCLLP